MSLSRALYFSFLVFLAFPYVYLGLYFFSEPSTIMRALENFDVAEFWWATKNSVIQAVLSSVVSLFLGAWLCFGVFQAKKYFGLVFASILQNLLILPSLLPSLFAILCLVNLIEPFPMGIIGVVIIHSFMNAGLVSFFFERIIYQKLAPSLELCLVEGSSAFLYLKTVFNWIKSDIFGIGLFVFVLCFSSLSVPLLVGGGKATTIEVLIYEKIKISGNFEQGLLIALLQLALIYLFSSVSFSDLQRTTKKSDNVSLLASKFGFAILVGFIFLPVIFFLKESLLGWSQVQSIPGLQSAVFEVLIPSVAFAVGTGILIAFLFLVLSLTGFHDRLFLLLQKFLAPSTAFLCFSLLLMLISIKGEGGIQAWIIWSVGFAYLVLPTLFRWGWSQELSSLRNQIEVAEVMGAGKKQIFFEIILPQVSKPLALLSGVGAFWALGDFAMGKFLIGEPKTLSMLIETLLSAYRLQAALALMGLLLVLGLIIMALFYGVEIVYRREFEKKL